MGLKEGLAALKKEPYERSEVPDKVGKAAQEVIPGFFTQGDVSPTYREHLLLAYMERDGHPIRVGDNGRKRTPDETRLDRAWNDVATRMDRSESDIRECVLRVYDGPGKHSSRPERLRQDFNEIVDRAESNE